MAHLIPYDESPVSLFGFMAHTVTIKDDLLLSLEEIWEVNSDEGAS